MPAGSENMQKMPADSLVFSYLKCYDAGEKHLSHLLAPPKAGVKGIVQIILFTHKEEHSMLKKVDINSLQFNAMDKIAHEWMLITAGNEQRGYNTMTASWGHLGSIWGHGGGKPTSVIYIRPQRYTKEFVDREEYYSLTFFPEEYKKALGYLGSHSGRDEDKVATVGLTAVSDEKTTWFREANLVLICRKLYHAPLLEEGFCDRKVMEEAYPNRDFHDVYIGEIVEAYQQMD